MVLERVIDLFTAKNIQFKITYKLSFVFRVHLLCIKLCLKKACARAQQKQSCHDFFNQNMDRLKKLSNF